MAGSSLESEVSALRAKVERLERLVGDLAVPPDLTLYYRQLVRGGKAARQEHNRRMKARRLADGRRC